MVRFFLALLFLCSGFTASAKLDKKELLALSRFSSYEFHRARAHLAKFKDLHVVVVAGKADTRFIQIPPAQWDRSFRWDDFSKTPAFGRLLCPGHPRNGTKKYLLVVQADATHDTLVHEFAHYLQAKQDKKVCEVYNRIEKNSKEEDKLYNQQLEYEVNRMLYENREEFNLSSLSELSIAEKLMKQIEVIGPAQKEVNATYGWSEMTVAEAKKILEAAIAQYQKRDSLATYGKFKSHLNETEIREGISLLTSQRVTLKQLPLCIEIRNQAASFKKIIPYAIQKWNELGQQVANQTLFKVGCKKPRIVIAVDQNLGLIGDGIIKLGIVNFDKGRATIVLRLKEFQEYENLLSAIVHRRLFLNSQKLTDLSGLKKRLEDFKHKKIVATSVGTVMHELGHALGLAHNFNEGEKSIMNYASRVQFSDYDREALKFVLTSKPPSQKFSPLLKPEKNSTFSE